MTTTATATVTKKKPPVRRRMLTALGSVAVLLIGYCVYAIAHTTVLHTETIKPQFQAMNEALAKRAAG